MSKINSKFSNVQRLSLILSIGWITIVVITAILTPLHVDECYYRLFGEDLSWGYFDHPPAVALFTRFSSIIFNGTLSVRFFSILAHVMTFILVYKLIDNGKSKKLLLAFITLVILLPLNHLYSFITTPDVPLLLATAFYFTVYKKLVKESTILIHILWGLSMAMMLYSKYHGVLVIFFTLISNPKLFLNYKTYLAGGLGILLLIPHFIWQYNHDFVSFVYHLSERMMMFSYSYPFEYLLNVLLIINPLFIGLFIKVLKKNPIENFDRALYFNLVGFLVFFAYQSFKVQVQPQWLFITYIPLIVLYFNSFEDRQWIYLKRVFYIVFPLLVAMHIFMIFDLLPKDLDIHRKKEYVEMIEKDAEGRKVMYYGSYGRASIHSWYGTQGYIHSHNGPRNRKNQFNIWERDSIDYGSDIYFVGQYGEGDRYKKYPGNYYGIPRNYKPVDKIIPEILDASNSKDSMSINLQITNPYHWDLNLKDDYALSVYFFKNGKSISYRNQFPHRNVTIKSNHSEISKYRFPFPDFDFDQFGVAITHVDGAYGPVHRRFSLENVDVINVEK